MIYENVQLASTNHDAVLVDVRKFVPDYEPNGIERYRLNADFDFVNRVDPSGYVMTINQLKDRELESATYDEKGDLLTEPIMAGELRIDVRVPEGYPLPELSTRVFPKNPDMEYQ